MLWNLRGTDVHILGTVHRADRPLPLSPAATAALGAADTVAFEANFEFEVDRSLTHYKPTDALSKHIPADLFAATQAAWTERGFAIEDLERSKPASIVFQIADVDCKRRGFEHRLGVDQGVLEFAKREKKKLYFLESTSDGYAYTATRVLTDPSYEGKELANVARHSGSLWARYALDSQWAGGAGVFAQGQRQGDIGNTYQLPGYARVDTMLAYRFALAGARAALQFNVDNLFDKKYYSGSHQYAQDWIKLGTPRTARATVRLDY